MMRKIAELSQKGKELKQRIAKFGAPLGNKNAAGPHDGVPGKGNQFTSGQTVRFEGASADGKVSGGMDVKVINPHSNSHLVTHTEGKGKNLRMYEGGIRHIPTVTVERPASTGSFPRPAKQFEAYEHTLQRLK